MNFSLATNILLQLSDFISQNLGLHFPENRWKDLENNITSASKEFGYKDTEKFVTRILTSRLTREHLDILTSHLTVNETFFWREHEIFSVLEKIILPEIINAKKIEKRIRIWSAGCSSGEEPYSIAISLKRVIPNISDWNISILATDINPHMLRKASLGEYSQWSFRGTPEWLKEKYFTPNSEKKFVIKDDIKNMVRFEYLNLAEDVFPSPLNNTNAIDILFCRNVLMYFTQYRIEQTINKFFNSIVNDGYLIVSASELSLYNFSNFKHINTLNTVFYKKSSKITDSPLITIEVTKETRFQPIQESIEVAIPTETAKVNDTKIESEISKETKVPLLVDSNYDLTLAYYNQGRYAEVIELLQKNENTIDEQILLIRALANQGKLNEALSTCEKAIANDKLEPRLYHLHAIMLQECNQLSEAVDSFKRAIYLDHNFFLSYYSLGNVYRRMGNSNNAKKCYENVLTILNNFGNDKILPEADGLTAGRFKEIINASLLSAAWT